MADKSVCSRDEHFILPFPIWETLITLSISFLCWGDLVGQVIIFSQVTKKCFWTFPAGEQLASADVFWPQGLAKQKVEVTTFSMLETPTSEHILGKFIFRTGVQPEEKQVVLPSADPHQPQSSSGRKGCLLWRPGIEGCSQILTHKTMPSYTRNLVLPNPSH